MSVPTPPPIAARVATTARAIAVASPARYARQGSDDVDLVGAGLDRRAGLARGDGPGSSSPAGKFATAATRTPVAEARARRSHSRVDADRGDAARARSTRLGDERVDRPGVVGALEPWSGRRSGERRAGGPRRSSQPSTNAARAVRRARRRRWASRSVCSWLSGSRDRPSARFVIVEIAATRRPAVAGDDRLVDGRHPDGVGAERAERADLGGRLEARAAHGEVDAVGERRAERVGRVVQRRAQRRGRRRRAGSGSGGRARRRWARRAGWTPSG